MTLSITRVGALLVLLAGARHAQAQIATDQLFHTGAFAHGDSSVFKSGSVYSLRYTGSDETIEYQINLGDPLVARGLLRVYEKSSDSFPVYNGGAVYRDQWGVDLLPLWLQQHTTLTQEWIDGDTVYLQFTDDYEGQHHRLQSYTLAGKSLRIRIQDLDGNLSWTSNYAGFYVGPTQGTESPKILQMQGALATPLIMFKNGAQHFYMANMLDLYQSNASNCKLDEALFVQPGPDSIDFKIDSQVQYFKDSAGKLSAPLDDTWSVVVSKKIESVLVTPSQDPSPYRELLTNRAVVNYAGQNWVDYKQLWNLQQSWGMDYLAGYFFEWSAGGADWPALSNVGPDWYPAIDAGNYASMVQAGVSKGLLLGMYTAFATMPASAPPAIYNASHIARTAAGAWKLSAQNGMPLMSETACQIHANREATLIKNNYGANSSYVDVQTYANPSGGADGDHIDQQAGTRWAKTLKRAIIDQKSWMRRCEDTLEGPMLGEGSISTQSSSMEWLWAGYCDSVQRVINTNAYTDASAIPAGSPLAPTNWPVIPEFELRVMQRLQCNHGNGFPDRFFGLSDGPAFVNMSTGKPLYPQPEVALDRNRVYEITYAKTAYFQSNGPYNGNGNYVWFADMLKEYYLMNALQQRYFSNGVSSIKYMYQGALKTFDEIYFATETTNTFRDPQIKIVYYNGLEIYVNHNPSAWTVTTNGSTYTIPEDGFLAYQPGTQFIAMSAIPQGTGSNRIDYCYAPNEYEFFDGRGVVNAFGGLDTGGLKRVKFTNFAHNVTGTEQSNGSISLTTGTPPSVTRIDIVPATVSLAASKRKGLKAIATYSNGAIQNVTSLVNWSSSNTGIAKINEGAALTAVSPGQATISVTTLGGATVHPATITVQ